MRAKYARGNNAIPRAISLPSDLPPPELASTRATTTTTTPTTTLTALTPVGEAVGEATDARRGCESYPVGGVAMSEQWREQGAEVKRGEPGRRFAYSRDTYARANLRALVRYIEISIDQSASLAASSSAISRIIRRHLHHFATVGIISDTLLSIGHDRYCEN
jgi:hypothetical protein